MPKPSCDFLARLLEGHHASGNEFNGLFHQCHEDQWLDYKARAILADPKKAAAMVREYVSAFANAEAGTLVIGVDEGPPPQIDGALAPGGRTLSGWAADAVASLPMAPPRFAEVATGQGNVLLIATQRSRSLVHCIDAGESVYHYRLGDTTHASQHAAVTDGTGAAGFRIVARLLEYIELLLGGVPPPRWLFTVSPSGTHFQFAGIP